MEKGFIMEAIKLCKEREETLLEEQQKKVDQPQGSDNVVLFISVISKSSGVYIPKISF